MRIGVIRSGSQPCTGHSRRCGNFSAPGTGLGTSGALHLGQVMGLLAIRDRRGKNKYGGEGGIRTHGRISPTHAFQACSLNRSDTSPLSWNFSSVANRGRGGKQRGELWEFQVTRVVTNRR